MGPFLNLIQIVVSIALIILILLQTKKSGLGSIFGGSDTIYTSRRGVDKTLFNFTIGLALFFFLIAIINVIVSS